MLLFVRLIAQYALLVYGVGGVAVLFYLRMWLSARQARQSTLFALERENAAHRQTRAGLMLVLLSMSLGLVVVLAQVVAPQFGSAPLEATPTANRPFQQTPPTPTLTPRPSPSTTLTPNAATQTAQAEVFLPEDTPTPTPGATPTPVPTLVPAVECTDPDQYLSYPTTGAVLAGTIPILGTADIPGFASYRLEIQGVATGGEWSTLAAFQQAVRNGTLGTWDTAVWESGDYLLRLVVVDQFNNFPEPCTVRVTLQSNGP